MRLVWIALVLVLATSVAHADAASDAWLGTWSGKVKAKGCADAPRKVKLEIAIGSDGVLRSSGDVLIEGLGDLDWRAAGKRLDGSRAGLTVTFARATKKKAKLALRTDGGCRITGTLTRIKKGVAPVVAATTGAGACEAYAAAVAQAARCDKLPQATRDALKQAHDQWRAAFEKMDAAGRASAEAACQGAADGLMQALTAAGC